MAAPAGIKQSRWNQAINVLSTEMAWSTEQADLWLNDVWANMGLGDEVRGQAAAHGRLRAWLESQALPGAPTLPRAFRVWAAA